jgi:hypothetical protein
MQVKQPTQANVEYVIYLQDRVRTALNKQKYEEDQVSKLSLKICPIPPTPDTPIEDAFIVFRKFL